MVPHFERAYSLARWLCRRDADAADVTQEAFVRALQYFDSYRGGDARAWLLRIVRNTALTWLDANRTAPATQGIEDAVTSDEGWIVGGAAAEDPEARAVGEDQALRLRRVLAELPLEQREVLVLRELEDLSYREIATITGRPIGTVMSRLSRARDELALRLKAAGGEWP